MRYWHLDPLIDRAALGVTELLTNVHRHAQPDKTCTVEIELLLDHLMVSVHDHDPRLPVVGDIEEVAPTATCGRGLAMVAAVSESWGVRPDGDSGKVVWFTLSTPKPATATPARPRAVRPWKSPRTGSSPRSSTRSTATGPNTLPPGPPLPADRAVTGYVAGVRSSGQAPLGRLGGACAEVVAFEVPRRW